MSDKIALIPVYGSTASEGGPYFPLKIINNNDGSYSIATSTSGATASSVSRSAQNGAKTFSVAAPTSVIATSILAANASRLSCTIENNGTQTVYLGKDATATSATGVPLASGATLTDDLSGDAWFAIAATGTADLRIISIQ